MLGSDFGERKGLTTFAEVEKVASLLRDLRCEWYVCGGWAVDLFLGRVTRAWLKDALARVYGRHAWME